MQVGSIYEFANKNPIFGVIEADSPLYTPILGLFMVTGFPTAGRGGLPACGWPACSVAQRWQAGSAALGREFSAVLCGGLGPTPG